MPDRTPDPFPGEPEPWPVIRALPLDVHHRTPRRERIGLHIGLLVATVVTTVLAQSGFLDGLLATGSWHEAWAHTSLAQGAWYSATILAILGCHEMGHYLACRYYSVDATLPFFLPAPILTGTLGAFIRIREPIRTKRALFDIGVAGPIAGFVVAVPATFLGVAWSQTAPLPTQGQMWGLGEPLLFKLAEWTFWRGLPDTVMLVPHPVAFGAWFGLLATALNLFPIGQLDGGHVSYAVLGRRSLYVTYAGVACAAVLTVLSSSWVVWTLLTITMLMVFGTRHPPTLDEHVSLDRNRLLVALLALVIFVLCFTPKPIEVIDLLPR